jgi:glycosyltransferase involved in cell wall biosynthesis
MHERGERGAVLVLPVRATAGGEPVAAWATTGGWAAGVERVLGSAWVLSDVGTFDPASALARVSLAGGTRKGVPARSPLRSRLRSLLPEAPITLAKDIRRALDGSRRARAVDPLPWRDRNLAFVWQRHELFRRCGVDLARELHVPLVLSVHAMQVEEAAGWGVRRPGWSRLAERHGELPQLRTADVVACVSTGVAESVAARGIPERRILVTPNGVDADRFRPGPPDSELREQLGLTGRFVVGWTGSFRGFHGLDVALGAMAQLQETRPDATLLLVGDGQQRAGIAARAAELGLGSVVFAGAVPFHDVVRHLRLCDAGLVLAPASGSFHYSPVKLREYLATGIPVIAHDVGELSATLTHERDALLVPRADPAALARAIGRLADDSSLRDRLRTRGPELARERWSWERPVRDVLERLAEQRALRP